MNIKKTICNRFLDAQKCDIESISDIKIREGRISDLNELMKILNEAPELEGGIGEETYTEDWIKDTLKNKDRNIVLIAEINGKLAGLLIAEIWKDKRNSFLVDLFVVSEYRKQGVAAKIIREYEKICKKLGINVIVMLVLTTNNNMQKFIEEKGYKQGNKFYFYEKKL